MAKRKAGLFKIGELVKRTGLTRQQVQNLLVMGLIKEESRTAAGHRLFGARVFRRLAVIRGLLAKGYRLAEIPGTLRTFLKLVLVCLLLGAAHFRAAGPARAAAPRPRLAKGDLPAIRRLFGELRTMMLEGDSGGAAALLAPSVSQQRLHQVVEQLDAEFESRSYTRFDVGFSDENLEVLSADRVGVTTIIRFLYHERSRGPVPLGTEDGLAFYFELVRTRGGWRIAEEEFFDTLASTQDAILGRVFLWAAIIFIVGSFWGWMFLDSCFRDRAGRKLPWILVAGLLPGAGALAYFFAVWMRQGPED